MAAVGVVVVAGGTSGVGRATVRRFARRGYDVAVLARGADGLEATAREVRDAGRNALPIALDVADSEAVDAAAERVEDELGEIDVWVNSAAAAVFATAFTITAAEIRRVTEVTYLGSVHGMLAALARMRPRDRGVIVQVGSVLAELHIPHLASYVGAKHAVAGFADAVRCDLAAEGSNVKLAVVHLPGVSTPLWDVSRNHVGRRSKPAPPHYASDVAARAVVHVAEHPRREIWVGETTAAGLLANRLSPRLTDAFLVHLGDRTQFSREPDPAGRADPLEEPLPGDRGADGRYAPTTLPASPGEWAARHRGLAAGAVLSGALAARVYRRRRRG
jgi:NADP-dependent 3-hydroxy acid dehydrogenase YdfG